MSDLVHGRHRLPPGPRRPSALQAVAWARRPLSFLEDCRARYGDTFTLRILHWGTWVCLCDPADVKRVFTADKSSLGVGLANPLLGPVLGPRSVMLLEEPEHMERRKLMLPSFHGESIQRDAERIAAIAREAVRRWPLGEPFEMWPRMQAITLEVVMRAVFGDDDDGRMERLRALLTELTEAMNSPRQMRRLYLFGPRWAVRSREYRETMAAVEAELLAEVRRRRAEGDDGRDGIVSMLVAARYEDGSLLSERDLRDELMTLLTDGPTSTSLAWVFERLLRHPEKLERLRDEVLAGGETPYLDAVVQETLRVIPPVPVVVRRLLEPMRLGGHLIPAGTMVAPCVALIHRDEAFYPDARSFVPERFLDEGPNTYTWIPFGGGVRRCLAASYAELEMKRVLRAVLDEVELRPVDSDGERMRKSAISFSPDRSALVIAEPRARKTAAAPPLADRPRPTPSAA
jgi:cytochrome P450